MSLNKTNVGYNVGYNIGYNNKYLHNIFIPGTPTVPTPINMLTPLQIVNLAYINEITIMLENKISVAVNSLNAEISATIYSIGTNLSTINDNASQMSTIINNLESKFSLSNNYIHVTDPIYYISTYLNIIIDNNSIIYLPQTTNDGKTIHIINNSGTSISISSQNNELIYSGFYINPNGSTNFILETSKIANLINIQKNNLSSWVLLLS